jgi:hypothetical protein
MGSCWFDWGNGNEQNRKGQVKDTLEDRNEGCGRIRHEGLRVRGEPKDFFLTFCSL